MDRGVDPESLSDARVHDFQILDVVVLKLSERAIGLTKHLDLLVVELLIDVRVVGQFEKRPGRGGGGSMLSGHEKRDPRWSSRHTSAKGFFRLKDRWTNMM